MKFYLNSPLNRNNKFRLQNHISLPPIQADEHFANRVDMSSVFVRLHRVNGFSSYLDKICLRSGIPYIISTPEFFQTALRAKVILIFFKYDFAASGFRRNGHSANRVCKAFVLVCRSFCHNLLLIVNQILFNVSGKTRSILILALNIHNKKSTGKMLFLLLEID